MKVVSFLLIVLAVKVTAQDKEVISGDVGVGNGPKEGSNVDTVQTPAKLSIETGKNEDSNDKTRNPENIDTPVEQPSASRKPASNTLEELPSSQTGSVPLIGTGNTDNDGSGATNLSSDDSSTPNTNSESVNQGKDRPPSGRSRAKPAEASPDLTGEQQPTSEVETSTPLKSEPIESNGGPAAGSSKPASTNKSSAGQAPTAPSTFRSPVPAPAEPSEPSQIPIGRPPPWNAPGSGQVPTNGTGSSKLAPGEPAPHGNTGYGYNGNILKEPETKYSEGEWAQQDFTDNEFNEAPVGGSGGSAAGSLKPAATGKNNGARRRRKRPPVASEPQQIQLQNPTPDTEWTTTKPIRTEDSVVHTSTVGPESDLTESSPQKVQPIPLIRRLKSSLPQESKSSNGNLEQQDKQISVAAAKSDGNAPVDESDGSPYPASNTDTPPPEDESPPSVTTSRIDFSSKAEATETPPPSETPKLTTGTNVLAKSKSRPSALGLVGSLLPPALKPRPLRRQPRPPPFDGQQQREDPEYVKRPDLWPYEYIKANSPQIRSSSDPLPIVIVVVFGGFRKGFISPEATPYLLKIADQGASVKYLQPSFPSRTFPNLLSIATGLYPSSHGLVNNIFYDSENDKVYNVKEEDDHIWANYKEAVPFWVYNELIGGTSGCIMWPGAAHPYGPDEKRPTYYHPKYNQSMPWETRVNTAIKWLTDKERPANLIYMYYHEPDACSHYHGPEGKKTKEQLLKADLRYKYLIDQLDLAGFGDKANLILMSDHGTQVVPAGQTLDFNTMIPHRKELVETVFDKSALLQVMPLHGKKNELYHVLLNSSKTNHFTVYRKSDLCGPPFFYCDSTRIHDFLLLADPGWAILDSYEGEYIKGHYF